MVTIEEIHRFAVEEGIAEDPRDEEEIEKELEERKEEYEKLEGVRKEKFDEDRLENPFDDSQVLYGEDEDVERVAVGIDIETQDLLLLDRLKERGEKIDGAIAHHPEGLGLSLLHKVMGIEIDTLERAGIPVSQAESIVKSRAQEVRKSIHGANHPRSPGAARLLDIPFMCIHTAADNHAHSFVKDYLDEKDPKTLGDVVDSLLEIPEYAWSLNYEMGPEIYTGSDENRAGKIGVFGFTGGTDLDENLIEKMLDSGIDTRVAMHAKKDQIEKAKEENIHIVSAGHMPSDSLGMNLLLDKIQEKFGVEVFPLSGFKRVERD